MTGGQRCFCRHEQKRTVVAISACDTCPLAAVIGQRLPTVQAPSQKPVRPPTPAELPCAHRSAEPVRSESCKSCSNLFGLRTINVYACARHEECTLIKSEVMRSTQPHRLAKWCETCKDRTPSELAAEPHSLPPSPSS